MLSTLNFEHGKNFHELFTDRKQCTYHPSLERIQKEVLMHVQQFRHHLTEKVSWQ